MPVVKLFANLRNIAGTKELSITPPAGMLYSASQEASLGAVITALIEKVPALDDVILENGQVRPHFVITINGHHETDLDTTITEQDIIAIFPPIAGG